MTSFPRQQARTRRFTLGVPRSFASGIGSDGPFVVFLRTDRGDDPVTHLWRHDVATSTSTKLVDARSLGADEAASPPEERARRERAREMAGGIVGFAADPEVSMAAFTSAGRLFTVVVATGELTEQPAVAGAFDPRPSPDGRRVAYHARDGVHVLELPHGAGERGESRELVVEEGAVWGRAEFVAAEEMGRTHGIWWSGDGSALAVTRVDERGVPVWTIADPSAPWTPAVPHAYPAAGTTNADVSLWIVDARDGSRVPVDLDTVANPYLAAVSWGDDPLTALVQRRDQRRAEVHLVDPSSGTTRLARAIEDDAWVELVPGTPTWAGASLVTVEDRLDRGHGGTRSLCLDGTPVTPVGLQVREVVSATEDLVVFLASGDDPTQVHVHRVAPKDPAFTVWSTTEHLPGVHREVGGADPRAPWVRVSSSLGRTRPTVTVVTPGAPPQGERQDLEVVAATPVVDPRPRLLELGPRRLRGALFLPSHDIGDAPLPVLLDPYGGPHAQRVVQAATAHLTSQWFADQGMAVLVVDGRGSPGRGPRWEHAVRGDLAGPVLEDQITALGAAARSQPRLDLDRVAIRGWSFGGYLAALAVLRRPDVFRGAIAGAPVSDWHLYDTHYTERYLGHPGTHPEAYARSGLVDVDGALSGARPWDTLDPPQLLLIHGLADDNVVAAHALRLSSALLAEGRSHRFLPLSGVTHMTPQEVVAEALLVEQVRFLQQVFGTPPMAS